jgi:hypothetical protein
MRRWNRWPDMINHCDWWYNINDSERLGRKFRPFCLILRTEFPRIFIPRLTFMLSIHCHEFYEKKKCYLIFDFSTKSCISWLLWFFLLVFSCNVTERNRFLWSHVLSSSQDLSHGSKSSSSLCWVCDQMSWPNPSSPCLWIWRNHLQVQVSLVWASMFGWKDSQS